MDNDFSLFEKRELRSKQRFNKKLFKCEGLVKKSLHTQHHRHHPDADDQIKRISNRLPNDGCPREWNHEITYSIKKKKRWALLDDFRSNIESWNGLENFDNLNNLNTFSKHTVSAFEKRLVSNKDRWADNVYCAYHGVKQDVKNSEEMEPVHRKGKSRFTTEQHLLNKPKVLKPKLRKPHRSRNDRRPMAAMTAIPQIDDAVPEEDTEVRFQYEFFTLHKYDQHLIYRDHCEEKRWEKYYSRKKVNSIGCNPYKKLLSSKHWLDQEADSVAENFKSKSVEYVHQNSYASITLDREEITVSPESIGNDQEKLIDFEFIDLQDTDTSDNITQVDFLFEKLITLEDLVVGPKKVRSKIRKRIIRPNQCEENSPLQIIDISNIIAPSSSSDVTDSTGLTLKSHLLSDDYFEMIPKNLFCKSETISSTYLQTRYGQHYYECSCIPRRFVVDVTKNVRESLESIYGDQCAKLKVQILCIFEIMPSLSFDNISTMKICVNGSFDKCVQNVVVDTIDSMGVQSIDHVVESFVKMAADMSSDNYQTEPMLLSSSVDNCIYRAPAQLFSIAHERCLDPTEAINEILEKENLFKKLQRQITAIADYDWFSNLDGDECGICLDSPVDQIGFCLAECGHWFCSKCWRSYCVERILNGRHPITCPKLKCDAALDYDTLTTFVPLPICQTYSEQLRDQSISKNSKEWSWCPNAKCKRLIKLTQDSTATVLSCICGYVWCKNCSSASHWPATCENAKRYVNKLKKRQDDPMLLVGVAAVAENRVHVVEVKRCPHCRITMEKGPGCICILCRCGKPFCWSCGGAWTTKSHEKCYSNGVVRGFVQVCLIDVKDGHMGRLRESYYERSLAHRMATRSAHVTKLRHLLLTNCWNTPKRLQSLFSPSLERKAISPVDSSFQRRRLAITIHVDRFFELRYQAHYLLEFIYAQLQFCTRSSWMHSKSFKWNVDRLEFALSRMEETSKTGDLRKTDEFMERVKIILQFLRNEISTRNASL